MATENGTSTYVHYYSPDEVKPKPWHGREPVEGLMTTDNVDCSSTGTTITTVSQDKNAYITGLYLSETSGEAQEFTLTDGSSNVKFRTQLEANEDKYIQAEKYPVFVLESGDISGQASDSDYVAVTITYFEE
ncbi:MAG: hypothetical protein ACOCQD_00240 [archaeon]